jgi:hypothetical protein
MERLPESKKTCQQGASGPSIRLGPLADDLTRALKRLDARAARLGCSAGAQARHREAAFGAATVLARAEARPLTIQVNGPAGSSG